MISYKLVLGTSFINVYQTINFKKSVYIFKKKLNEIVYIMQHSLVYLLLLLGLSTGTTASKILIYPFGHCLNSHLLNAEKLANILTNHGHQVTMLVSYDYKELDHIVYSRKQNTIQSGSKVKLLQFDGPSDFFPVCNYDTIDFILYSPISKRFDALTTTFLKYCEQIIKNNLLMTKLKETNFDVFVIESLDPCSRILADYVDIPFIQFITTGLGHWDGNFRPPSYLPAAIAPYTPIMTFSERIINFLMKTMYENIPIFMGFDSPFQRLKLCYGLNTSISIADTTKRAAIKLVNSNFAVDYPAPIEPDTILIGGFSVDTPTTLNKEYLDFMESSHQGVIIMSFGTLISTFEPHWASIFMDAFEQLPEKIVWKYKESNSILPTNASHNNSKMLLSRWIPQVDLLAHPNTKLFITHCGLNGMYEAINYGVPVLALPLSADQFNQAGKLTNYLKMGEQLDINTITSQKIYDTVKTILSNPIYGINAKLAQERFRDQPSRTAESVNYWVNYVIRNKGAEHLKSEARNLTWYQFFSLDVISAIFILLIGSLSLLVAIISSISKGLKKYCCLRKTMLYIKNKTYFTRVQGNDKIQTMKLE